MEKIKDYIVLLEVQKIVKLLKLNHVKKISKCSRECCVYAVTGSKRVKQSCKVHQMKNCGVVLKQTCYDRCKDKVVGRCTQKECCKFCNGKKKQNCFLFGQKTCKAVISKVCNMSRTEKNNCRRKRCCTVSENYGIKTTVSCIWVGQEQCVESFYNQCRMIVTRPSCRRVECCTFGVKGNKKEKFNVNSMD